MICIAPASLNTPYETFLLTVDMPSSQTQPRCGPATQLTGHHMLSVFLWSILMPDLRGAISLCNIWHNLPLPDYLHRSSPAQSNATLAEHALSLRPPQPAASFSLKSSFLSFMSSRNIVSPLISSPETQVNQLKARSCIPSSLPCATCVPPPRLPAHLGTWQHSQFYPNCCNSQSISHTLGLTVRWNVQFLLINTF